MTHAGQLQLRVNGAQVDYVQAGLQLPRQHTDRRAPADEVAQHLPGHRLRVGRDAFLDHTVVTGKNADCCVIQGRPFTPLQAGQLNGQTFQLAERTGRFGQLLLTGAGLVHGGVVEGLAGVTPPGLGHSAGPLSIRGRPATVSTTR
ncbi:hypothetical protein D3C75_817060 [compost metagenome]